MSGFKQVIKALPLPFYTCGVLSFIVVVVSSLANKFQLHALHPIQGEVIAAANLLNFEVVVATLESSLRDSLGPLLILFLSLLGLRVAEKSGLLASLIRIILLKSNRKFIFPAVLFAGIVSHTAGDLGYILLIPMAAMAFHSYGMHPLAGLVLCFAGVSGGFAANLLLGSVDFILASITQVGAQIIDPNFIVSPLSNWYFLACSCGVILTLGLVIGLKHTVPRLGNYSGPEPRVPLTALTAEERRGLRWTGWALGLTLSSVGLAVALSAAVFNWPITGALEDARVFGSFIGIFLFVCLIAFAMGSKSFPTKVDFGRALKQGSLATLPYVLFFLSVAVFIGFVKASHLGVIFSVKGADWLRSSGLGPMALLFAFMILTLALDFFLVGASAKWAFMAPIFVPMFMLLGLSPEVVQAAYRISDSVINVVSPFMLYLPLVHACARKYEPELKLGKLFRLMAPYSICFFVFWTGLFFFWVEAGIPLGPGSHVSSGFSHQFDK